jgi:hypothetical protein
MITEILLAIIFLCLIGIVCKLDDLEEFKITKLDLRDYVSKSECNDLIEKLNKNERMLREYLNVEEDSVLIKGEKTYSGLFGRGYIKEPYIKRILVKKKK